MRVVAYAAIADDDVGRSRDDGGDDFGNILADILTIGVGVDDNVGPGTQSMVHAALERGRQSTVPAMPDDVMYTEPAGYARFIVAAAVIDHEYLYLIDACDLARKRSQGLWEMVCLVQARNLDYQLGHCFPRHFSRE